MTYFYSTSFFHPRAWFGGWGMGAGYYTNPFGGIGWGGFRSFYSPATRFARPFFYGAMGFGFGMPFFGLGSFIPALFRPRPRFWFAPSAPMAAPAAGYAGAAQGPGASQVAGGPAGTPPQAGGTGRRWTESHPFVSPPPPPPSIGGGAAPAAAGKAGGGGGGGEVFKPEKPPAATLLTKAKHGWTEAQAAMRNEIWGIQGTANGLNYKAYPNAQAKGQVQVTITPKTNANIQNKNDLEAALKRLKHEFEKVGGKLTWDRVELPKTPAATPTAIPAAPAQGTSPAATGKVAESFFNSTIAGLRGRRFVAKADGNYQAGTLKITLNIAANTLQPGQHDALNIVKGNLSGITVTITDKDGKAVQL